ncbi:MAG: hypothetical protein KAS32_12170 [Candidatus Peribacteraceae bacterium]|nr:hypothetical protein [Candidatus Peribacteraceae bacterium]
MELNKETSNEINKLMKNLHNLTVVVKVVGRPSGNYVKVAVLHNGDSKVLRIENKELCDELTRPPYGKTKSQLERNRRIKVKKYLKNLSFDEYERLIRNQLGESNGII